MWRVASTGVRHGMDTMYLTKANYLDFHSILTQVLKADRESNKTNEKNVCVVYL